MAKQKKRSTRLKDWYSSGSLPLYVVDSERFIFSFNRACETLTGWGAAEIIDQTANFCTPSDAEPLVALACALAPPPEALSGAEVSIVAHLVRRDGSTIPRRIQFQPFFDEERRVIGVLGIINDLPAPTPRDESPARQLHAELAALKTTLRQRYGFKSCIAQSDSMKRVLAQAELAQTTTGGLLLSGERGVGKEHLARAIHLGSTFKSRAFLPLNCRFTTADEILRIWSRLEDEFQSGAAASGSNTLRPGSVMFVEIESLARDVQQRVVDSRLVADHSIRLMASASYDAQTLLTHDNIVPAFLALVSSLEISIPVLSKRQADIPLLAQHFLEESNRLGEKQIAGFDEAVWPLFHRFEWSKNLDQLAEVIANAHQYAAGRYITPDDLPYRFHAPLAAQAEPPRTQPGELNLDFVLEQTEARLLQIALERTHNNKSKAAELLGINRARLLRRIEQLRINTGGPDEPE